jgi:hypothetical protein
VRDGVMTGQGVHGQTRSKKRALWVGFVAFWVVVLFMSLFLRPKSLADHAEIFLLAILDGNTRTMMKYSYPEEIERNRLSAQTLEALHREVLSRRLSGFERIGTVEKEVLGGGDQGHVAVRLTDSKGRIMDFGLQVWSTPDGPKGSIVATVIGAWVTDKVVRNDLPVTAETRLEAQLEGLKEDREILQRLGIYYLHDVDLQRGTLRPAKWEDAEKFWQLLLERRRA